MTSWAALSRPFSNLYEIFKIPIYDNYIGNHLTDDALTLMRKGAHKENRYEVEQDLTK